MNITIFCLAIFLVSTGAEGKIQKDVIKTGDGNITISFLGHGTLMLQFKGKTIQVDPWRKQADYSKLPKADIILVTHEHFDHLDTAAIALTSSDHTQIITNEDVRMILNKGTAMKNGDSLTVDDIRIEAVPAYNTTPDHAQYHPKGRDNGFVLTMGGKRLYIAGDTENIPEMAELQNIDIAFLPMNQPYTMTPQQVVDAIGMFHPRILYPYHTGDTDVSQLKKLMAKEKGTELRIRPMK